MSEPVFTLYRPKGALRGHRGAYGGCAIDVGRVEVSRGDMTFSEWYHADKDFPNGLAVDFYPRKGEKPLRVYVPDTKASRESLVYVLEQVINAIKELV